MSTFGHMANRIIADASLQKFGMTAEMVLPWLVSAYEDLITAFPLGETTRQVERETLLPGKYDTGLVSATAGSDIITGSAGATFEPFMDNWFIRFKNINNRTWYRMSFIDSTHLRAHGIGIISLSTGTAEYTLAPRYGAEPSGLRWITNIRLEQSPTFHEVSVMQLDEMFPDRDSDPGLPLYWAKAQWSTQPPYRRYIEIYPPPDKVHYVQVRGYASIDEPTLASYPFAGIPDQVLIDGASAHAWNFIAGQLVNREGVAIDQIRAALDVAQRHKNMFEDFKIAAKRRDDRDTKSPKISVLWRSNENARGVSDPTSSAYWEVWRK